MSDCTVRNVACFAAGFAASQLVSRWLCQQSQAQQIQERRASGAAASTSEPSAPANPFYVPPCDATPDSDSCALPNPDLPAGPNLQARNKTSPVSRCDSQPLPERTYSQRQSFERAFSQLLPDRLLESDAEYETDEDLLPAILPFSIYAACRLLDTTPDNLDNGQVYESLVTMAAYYLRADRESIVDCIQVYGLNDLLFSVARVERAFGRSDSASADGSGSEDSAMELRGEDDEAAKLLPKSRSRQALSTQLATVREVVASLMHELEVILHEYLSFHWNHVDDLLEANAHILRKDGLVCPWRGSASDLQSLPNTGFMCDSPTRSFSASSEGSHVIGWGTSFGRPPAGHHGIPHVPSARNALSMGQRSDSTSNFDDYLHASPSSQYLRSNSDKARKGLPPAHGQSRATHNWKRARNAVTKKVTMEMLGTQRRFQTLYEIFEDLNKNNGLEPQREDRAPILLLLGGGMAAGKSTVREIIGHDDFWSKVGKDAVVIEADAIKNRDVVFKQLSRMESFASDNNLSQYVHEYSTKAAESMLVTAVNSQKDIVFDGTMTWAPFVEQTMAMVRDHKCNYTRGPGQYFDKNGVAHEKYWVVDECNPTDVSAKRPYRIELVGVTCDPGLAVARGLWRKIRTGRGVPVASQLRSHRLFSENFERFAMQADSATLYHTGSALTTFNKADVDLSPSVIAHRSSATRGEMLVNPPAYEEFKHKANINDKASCRARLNCKRGQCGDKIPISEPDSQMSTLRQALRAADCRERQRRATTPQASGDLDGNVLQ